MVTIKNRRFFVLEIAQFAIAELSCKPGHSSKSARVVKPRAQLLGQSKGARQTVKIIAFLYIWYAVSLGCLNYAHGENRNEILGLWRTVFARPENEAVSKKVAAPHELVELGELLFQDRRLSRFGTRACASCHNPSQGFSNGLARAEGLDGLPLDRNVPTLLNLAWGKSFNFDGRSESLEKQARGPIENENEMGGGFETIVARLQMDPSLQRKFAAAFPGMPQISEDLVLRALAAFERTLVSPKTTFDLWIAGDEHAFTPEEQLGFRLFVGKAGCVGCHVGWRATDDGFHDIGLPMRSLGKVTSQSAGKKGVFAFKIPTLRGVKLTAPYMHDGSKHSLEDVVDHYAEGVVVRRGLSELLQPKISLSEEERRALVSFLKTL